MEIKLLTPTDASAYWELRLEALTGKSRSIRRKL